MEWVRNYFQEHKMISYFTNAMITFIFVIGFPSLFMPNFTGFLLGIIVAILLNAVLGAEWEPFSEKKTN